MKKMILTLIIGFGATAHADNRLQFLILSEGDISRTESELTKIRECKLLNETNAIDSRSYWGWKKIDNNYICQIPAKDSISNKFCRVGTDFSYRIKINEKFMLDGESSNEYVLVKPGTVINMKDTRSCEEFVQKERFPHFSTTLLSKLEDVKRGRIWKTRDSCYTAEFRFSFDPESNRVAHASFGNNLVKCP